VFIFNIARQYAFNTRVMYKVTIQKLSITSFVSVRNIIALERWVGWGWILTLITVISVYVFSLLIE